MAEEAPNNLSNDAKEVKQSFPDMNNKIKRETSTLTSSEMLPIRYSIIH